MTTELVHLTVLSGIATITLDSPANRNAMSAPLRAQLLDALERTADDDSVRVVVLEHTGPVFCAGMDLTEPPAAVNELPPILEGIGTHPKPVVAKLAGHARAGGIGLVAAADIAVAAAHTTFAFTEVRLGVVPAVISVTVLPRVLPRAAHELFLTGETFDATRALAIGLLNSAVPADQLDSEVDRYTGMLIKGAPQALALTKQLPRGRPTPDFAAMLELSAARFASAEAQEGIRAFTQKRPPAWVRPPFGSERRSARVR
ncbi:MAG: enoyl-CoA hydratase/isomerase family protein [Pseudonocardiales bacterium]|nr:enoyl-CoA hydratase/isomerase family protein [Pseudonocardiales bacterium]MBV9030836.1 enoyl-CoA hydratase/isomerase family protein [Pseudonocardiales bacterium]MBW0011191.1 enoyl-CoA hydratase/isomerase family protein [Pseudonocardiales bacterium]